jgi:hypothetical protein
LHSIIVSVMLIRRVWTWIVRTFLPCICLHEALSGASFLEFGGEPCELGEVLIDDANFGREVVVV